MTKEMLILKQQKLKDSLKQLEINAIALQGSIQFTQTLIDEWNTEEIVTENKEEHINGR